MYGASADICITCSCMGDRVIDLQLVYATNCRLKHNWRSVIQIKLLTISCWSDFGPEDAQEQYVNTIALVDIVHSFDRATFNTNLSQYVLLI